MYHVHRVSCTSCILYIHQLSKGYWSWVRSYVMYRVCHVSCIYTSYLLYPGMFLKESELLIEKFSEENLPSLWCRCAHCSSCTTRLHRHRHQQHQDHHHLGMTVCTCWQTWQPSVPAFDSLQRIPQSLPGKYSQVGIFSNILRYFDNISPSKLPCQIFSKYIFISSLPSPDSTMLQYHPGSKPLCISPSAISLRRASLGSSDSPRWDLINLVWMVHIIRILFAYYLHIFFILFAYYLQIIFILFSYYLHSFSASPWTQEHISGSVGLVRQSCSEQWISHFFNSVDIRRSDNPAVSILKFSGYQLWRIIDLEVLGKGRQRSFARRHFGRVDWDGQLSEETLTFAYFDQDHAASRLIWSDHLVMFQHILVFKYQ